MKIQSLSTSLFSIGGITYPKGDFIPEYGNLNYQGGIVDQSQCEPVVNLVNKKTGVPMFKATIRWNDFRDSSGNAYANFNALQLALASIVVGSSASIGATGPTGPQGPAGPAGLAWKGAWVSGTSYVKNDAVGYGGASYFCILATSGTTTPNLATTNWALLASQGAVGPAGATGPTGATGAQGDVGPTGPGATQTLAETIATGNIVPFNTVWNENGSGDNLILNADGIKLSNEFDTSYGSFTAGSMFYSNGSTYISASLPTTIVGANKTILFPDASGTIALQTYKTWRAVVNSTSVVRVLVDEIGFTTPTITNPSNGKIVITKTGFFTSLNDDKLDFITGTVNNSGTPFVCVLSKDELNPNNSVILSVFDMAGGQTGTPSCDFTVEIRIYN